MKIKQTNKVEPRIVAMKDMKPGEIGKITSSYSCYGGTIITCIGVNDTKIVVSLDGEPHFWYTGLSNNSIPVELFPVGTKFELEVE